ncbi:MAG: RNA polymerase factor sigma-32 [Magnetococcales bacterium]|nr:RNA polymerase factor sigma-32 [Magnetococcales bacterium]
MNTSLPVVHGSRTLPVPVGLQDGAFERFLTTVQNYPYLSAKEEEALFERFRLQEDLEAAHQLVCSHLRLVVKIAREYLGYHSHLPDLVQEGTLGLMQAVKRFDPSRGARLATFALWWIRSAIHEFILQTWSLVKIGTTQMKRRLFFKLRQNRLDASILSHDEAEELAQRFQVDRETILEMDARLYQRDISLNAPSVEDGEDRLTQLPDHRPNPEVRAMGRQHQLRVKQLVSEGMAGLDHRERLIVQHRFLEEETKTLAELGEMLSLTRERIRQLEKKAMEKLARTLSALPAAREVLG